jgi:hypothetical protein
MNVQGLPQGRNGTDSINKKLPTQGTPVCAAKATGTLSMATKPTADDTVTIGSNVYTFVATPAAAGDVALGAAVANSQANLVTAINDGDDYNDPHPTFVAADFSSDEMVITAKEVGTAANGVATEETFTDGTDAWAAATTSGGVVGTPGSPGDQLIDASYLYICVEPDTVAGNWRRISLGSAY